MSQTAKESSRGPSEGLGLPGRVPSKSPGPTDAAPPYGTPVTLSVSGELMGRAWAGEAVTPEPGGVTGHARGLHTRLAHPNRVEGADCSLGWGRRRIRNPCFNAQPK